jgi:lysophospholipase L1-like esterase
MRVLRLALLPVLALAAMLAFTLPASAAGDNYVALGDSYSSGVGAGSYLSDSGSCKRSQNAYAELWASSHSVNSLTFVACSGAVTSDVINSQVNSLSSSTTLVTITIGGNDAGFADVMETCNLGSDQDCVDRVNEAKAFATSELPGRLDNTYNAIRQHAPSARVIVLGYPRMYAVPGSCWAGLSDTKRSAINSGADTVDQVTASRASAHGFTFGDVRGTFGGHELCSGSPWLHSWSWPIDESYHPTASGQNGGYYAELRSITG